MTLLMLERGNDDPKIGSGPDLPGFESAGAASKLCQFRLPHFASDFRS